MRLAIGKPSKVKCKPRKKMKVYADTSALNLGFSNCSEASASKVSECDPITIERNNSVVIDVSVEPLCCIDPDVLDTVNPVLTESGIVSLNQSLKTSSFLSDTGSDDEEDTPASVANNYWF